MLDGTLLACAVVGVALYGMYRMARASRRTRDDAYEGAEARALVSDYVLGPETVNPGVWARAAQRGWQPPRPPPRSTSHGDARFADMLTDGAAMAPALGGAKGIWFGFGINLSGAHGGTDGRDISYGGDRHLLTVAPTGSGKGSCAIIPNLLMLHHLSVICIDPKGQNAAVTGAARAMGGKNVYFLNPFGMHAEAPWYLPRHRFNPLAHLRIDDPHVVAEVASLAQALIVTESKTQPYFDNSARDLVKALILHAVALKGGNATLLDMRAWLGQPMTAAAGRPSLTAILRDMARSPYRFISEPASRFLSDARSVEEVVQSASTQTEFLSDPCIAEALSASDFTIAEFKEQPTTLYIMLPDMYLDSYARFMRVVTIAALDGLRANPGGTRTLVILDEFPRLGHMAAVENAFALARGYNVQLWPFVQDLNQLKETYGERWGSFIANAGIVQWFTPNDPFTAEYLSRRIGKTTIETSSRNTSTTENTGNSDGATLPTGPNSHNSRNFGRSYSSSETSSETFNQAAADFLSPQDLYDFPDYFQLLTLAGLKYPILATRENYYEWAGVMADIRAMGMPDPFHVEHDVSVRGGEEQEERRDAA